MVEAVKHPWLKHYPKEIPHHLEYDEKPLFSYLQQAAAEDPNGVALHFMGKELSYQAVYENALKIGNELRRLGLEKGDRVAIMLPNTPQSVFSYYGVLLAGGIVVQTNPLYTERELKHQLNDSGAKMIICVDLVHPRVMNVKDSTALEHVIVTSIKDFLPFPKNLLYPLVQRRDYPDLKLNIQYNETMHRLKDLLKRGSTADIELDIDPKKDVALLQYTGGTTGLAKGVVLTHFNLTANTEQGRAWMYQAEAGKEVVLAILPFFHVYGMTVVMNFAIMMRSKMIIVPRFDAAETLKIIQKHKPTLFPGAPTMYIGLVNHPDINDYDLSSIDACLSGAAALPTDVQEKFEEATKGKLVEGYGLTEAAPVTHSNFIWDKRVAGSIGVPWPDTVAKIVKEDGTDAEVKEIGELVIKGPQVMQGYWNLPEETEETLKDGWLYTGDMGYMDEEGYFYIVDRKKDMIIAGGFNIYPREIEEVLFEHEAIKEAVIVGIPDDYRGETVKAYIVLREGSQITEKELDEYCRKHLAAYKVPRVYEFRDELPKSMVGKVLRRELLEEELAKAKKD